MRIEKKEIKLKNDKESIELDDATYALLQAIQELSDSVNKLTRNLPR